MRFFNVTGSCDPARHYMIPAERRLPGCEALVAKGRFRVTADSPEMVELFQKVARRAGDVLQRPVVSYANGREIMITFGHEAPGLTL